MSALTLWNEIFENELTGSRNFRGQHEFKLAVDLVEHPEYFQIHADMPGLDKKDVKIEVKDGVLSISGERVEEHEKKDIQFYRRERTYGKFNRSFNLGNVVDEKNIAAEFKNGSLNVKLPKKSESVSRIISLE